MAKLKCSEPNVQRIRRRFSDELPRVSNVAVVVEARSYPVTYYRIEKDRPHRIEEPIECLACQLGIPRRRP